MEEKKVLSGFAIVVAERGFVYVGHIQHDGEWCVITNAKNIRYWGTTKGLGELALCGPTDKTKLDDVGTARIPAHAVINILDTCEDKWTSCK